MKKYLYIVVISLFSGLMTSCTIGRYLDTPADLYINGSVSVSTESSSQKYINKQTDEYYGQIFIQELESSLAGYNITLIDKPDFTKSNLFSVKINNLEMEETYVTETVYPDTTSLIPETYNVTSCNVDVGFEVFKYSTSGEHSLKTSSVNVEKEEKLNTNRTFWQILFGTNKDNSQYTYHELSDNVFDDLVKKSARNVAAKISKAISREMK